MLKFSINKEELLFSKLLEIAENIKDSTSLLNSLYLDIFNTNYPDATAKMVKIKGIYERIALIREDIISMLYGEAFLPDFKESMLTLTQSLYEIMKSIKDAGRAITSRKPDEKLCTTLQSNFVSYLSLIQDGAEKLVLMISLLKKDIKEAIRIGKEIQLIERNGDEIKDLMIQRLYENEKESDIISILQLKDVITFLDDILDGMEDSTLSVETLYATLKS
jgi:Phosphate transport regulator (distant homolog of PhoU)